MTNPLSELSTDIMEKARTLDLLGFISNGMKVSAKKKYIWDQMKTEEL